MMITLMMCLVGLTYGQTDSLVNECTTNKVSIMGTIMSTTCTFNMYNDSLVRTSVSGAIFKNNIKNNIPNHDVTLLKLQNTSVGNIISYKYEDDTKNIQITFNKGKGIVLWKIKDSFSGKITEFMYY